MFKPLYEERKGDLMADKMHSLAHTKWMCKYHIAFTPKYRRKVIYNQYKSSLRDILKQLCRYKGVEILEGHLMVDHIHMLVSILLVSILPKISVSTFMGYLKGKSALMMFDKHANLKYTAKCCKPPKAEYYKCAAGSLTHEEYPKANTRYLHNHKYKFVFGRICLTGASITFVELSPTERPKRRAPRIDQQSLTPAPARAVAPPGRHMK